MSSSSDSNNRMKTAEQEAADKAQKKREKRMRQLVKKNAAAAASLSKMACIGSSDSDGFVHVDMEDARSLADKARDDEIRRIETNLARLKAARKDASSTESEQSAATKVCRSDSTEELRSFAAQLPYPQGVVDMA
eukprot:6404702-Amphidinium_carterae.1